MIAAPPYPAVERPAGALAELFRAMDPEKDREWIEYYRERQPGRQVWMLDADQAPPRLAAYPHWQADGQTPKETKP
jgi:hypothetical protein